MADFLLNAALCSTAFVLTAYLTVRIFTYLAHKG
jgi:hypothetical protein